jgi:LPXTG-motif cell wall-anchored protein
MTNTFGNTVAINVNCPTPKVIEQTVAELPHTGASANMIFAGAVLATVTFFYARSRQLKTEVRLIRRDLNAGTI